MTHGHLNYQSLRETIYKGALGKKYSIRHHLSCGCQTHKMLHIGNTLLQREASTPTLPPCPTHPVAAPSRRCQSVTYPYIINALRFSACNFSAFLITGEAR